MSSRVAPISPQAVREQTSDRARLRGPHYSIKQASRDLGRSLACSGLVVTANAEGLFNDNALPYRTIVGRAWSTYRPDVIVIVFDDPEGLLSREYRLGASSRLYTSWPIGYLLFSEAEQSACRPTRSDTRCVEHASDAFARNLGNSARACYT